MWGGEVFAISDCLVNVYVTDPISMRTQQFLYVFNYFLQLLAFRDKIKSRCIGILCEYVLNKYLFWEIICENNLITLCLGLLLLLN